MQILEKFLGGGRGFVPSDWPWSNSGIDIMYKAQLAFREAVMSVGPLRAGRIVVGTILAPSGKIEGERAYNVRFGTDQDGRKAGFTLSSPASETPDPDRTFSADMNWVLGHSLKVQSPDFPGNLLTYGFVFARHTRMPSPGGYETIVLMGIVVTAPDAFGDRSVLYRFEGEGRSMSEVGRENVPDLFETGSTPGQSLGLPIWGYGDEPRAFSGLLCLDFADLADRWEELSERTEVLSAEEAAELAVLRDDHELQSYLRTGLDDTTYREYRRLMRERLCGSWKTLAYPTAVELHRMDQLSRDVLAEVLEWETHSTPGM